MKRIIKRIVCAALAASMLCVFAAAGSGEGEAVPVETTKVESEPVQENKPAEAEPTTAPTEASEETAASEEEQPGVPTEKPTEEATSEPTDEPSEEPTNEPTPAPSEEPSLEPSLEPTPEPSPTPAPGGITITASGEMQGNVCRVTYQTMQESVSVSWNAVEGALSYRVWIVNSNTGTTYSTTTDATEAALKVADFIGETQSDPQQSGSAAPNMGMGAGMAVQSVSCTLYVEAIGEEDIVLASGNLNFELARSGGRRPGGGGMRFGGGSGAPEEQGFHVTPGVALTDTHSTGTKDMRIYGTIELPEAGAALQAISLDDATQLLLNGGETFDAALDGQTLILTAEQGEWSFSLRMLKALHKSGIDTLKLCSGGDIAAIPTGLELKGVVYASLSAQGAVSKDYQFTVSGKAIRISAAGNDYVLNENNELTAFGG